MTCAERVRHGRRETMTRMRKLIVGLLLVLASIEGLALYNQFMAEQRLNQALLPGANWFKVPEGVTVRAVKRLYVHSLPRGERFNLLDESGTVIAVSDECVQPDWKGYVTCDFPDGVKLEVGKWYRYWPAGCPARYH